MVTTTPAPSLGKRQRRRASHAVRLRPRAALALTVVSAVGVVAFCWPLLVQPGSGLDGATTAPWLFVALLPLLLAVVLAEVADGPTADVVMGSPAFAPQVAKVLAPQPWLTVAEVAHALRAG